MKTYAIVFFPKIKSSDLDKFRKEYDPKAEFIEPHVTLVFPFSVDLEIELINHIKNVVSQLKTFPILLHGYEKSFDNYLFLLVDKGTDNIIKVHDKLYTHLLSPFLRKDIEYVPHLTIGYFENSGMFDESQFTEAMNKAKELNMKFDTTFDSLDLISIEDQFAKRVSVAHFELSTE